MEEAGMAVAEVAASLRVPVGTVWEWLDAGTLRGALVGDELHISPSAFDAFVASSRVDPGDLRRSPYKDTKREARPRVRRPRPGLSRKKTDEKDERPMLTRALLVEMYIGRLLSASQIAEKTGWGETAVSRALRGVGVNIRGHGTAGRTLRADGVTRGELVELHHVQRLSLREVADRLGMGVGALQTAMILHDVPMRPAPRKGLPGLEEGPLRRLYEKEGLSPKEIAEQVGCSLGGVYNALSRHGIALRPQPKGQPVDAVDVLNSRR